MSLTVEVLIAPEAREAMKQHKQGSNRPNKGRKRKAVKDGLKTAAAMILCGPCLVCYCVVTPAITGKPVQFYCGTPATEANRRHAEAERIRKLGIRPVSPTPPPERLADPFPRVLLVPVRPRVRPHQAVSQPLLLHTLPYELRLSIYDFVFDGLECHASITTGQDIGRDGEFVVLRPCAPKFTGSYADKLHWPGYCQGIGDPKECGAPVLPRWIYTLSLASTCRTL